MKFLIAIVAVFVMSCAGTTTVEEPQAAPEAPAAVEEVKPCDQKDPPDCDVEAVAEPVEAPPAEEAPAEPVPE